MKIIGVEEEEYCYIPMGGELPDLTQRIVGFGGAANMVHPATGNITVEAENFSKKFGRKIQSNF